MHNPRSHVFDSNGPSVRIRGSALQIYEKYTLLARDSQRTDRIAAENLAQHAEHYYRLANANNALSNGADRRGPQGQPNGAAQDGAEDDGQQPQSREGATQSPEVDNQEAVAEVVSPPPSSLAESETAASPRRVRDLVADHTRGAVCVKAARKQTAGINPAAHSDLDSAMHTSAPQRKKRAAGFIPAGHTW